MNNYENRLFKTSSRPNPLASSLIPSTMLCACFFDNTAAALWAEMRTYVEALERGRTLSFEIDFFDVKSNPPPKLSFPAPKNHIPAASSTVKNLEDSLMLLLI